MARKIRNPQRIIEAAVFDGIGPVTAGELLCMPDAQWGLLRDRITDYRHGRPTGLRCRCMGCGDPVFIRARRKEGRPLPLFSHFQHGGQLCPWHHEPTKTPDAVRAAQYQGQQESAAHRMLCEQIDAMARLDERYIASHVNAYRPPTANEYGRFPDVAVEWRGFPEFVVEVQLSKTFQTEISARCTHYEREGVALIWVLWGVTPLEGIRQQSFIDVIRRHRYNAFVIDRETIAAAHEKKTLVLKCFLQNDSGAFDSPRLITMDDLKFPEDGLPYLEDKISGPLLKRINDRRQSCFAFLRTIAEGARELERRSPEREILLLALRKITPRLSVWENDGADEENAILRLIAVLFSVISDANRNYRRYATKHANVTAMLNTMLNGRQDIQRNALIIECLLDKTPIASLLNGTVGQHIARAKTKMDGNLCLQHEPEWAIVKYLIPEIFDPLIRDEMIYLSILPEWAKTRSQQAVDELIS